MTKFLDKPTLLGQGAYLQLVVEIALLDDAIIRSNEPEEVLTYHYKTLGNRFIIPWRKIKGKLRRLVMEKQREQGIQKDCALKDDLCLNCPSCLLFGGTGETSSNKVSYNILSRVMGETFISREVVTAVQNYTQNAVGEKDLMTGQALMTILTVPRETVFLGVVTVKDPTKEMAAIVVENIKRLSRLGARSVEWGRAEAKILEARLSDREDVSAYHLLGPTNSASTINLEILNGLPKAEDAYKELHEQIPELFKELIEKRSPKKDKKAKPTKETPELPGETSE